MAEKKDIVCPNCGRYLGSTSNSSGGGEKTCPGCKRRIVWQATPSKVYVSTK